jgi:hypothetical protein
MTIKDAIALLFGKDAVLVGQLVALLQAYIVKFPDLAGEINPIIAKFNAAVDPAALAELGAAIPGELLNIAQGKFDPRDHASGSI